MSSEGQNFEHRAELVIADDQLSAVLSITPGQPDEAIDSDSICNYLDAQGIDTECVFIDKIAQLLDQINEAPDQSHSITVAQGTPAIDAQPTKIDFDVIIQNRIDKIETRHEPCNDKNGDEQAIDFYAESQYLIVEKNQRIGQLAKATSGKSGSGVMGQAIDPASIDNDSTTAKELFDDSLRSDPDGTIYASCDGQLVYNSNPIQVLETLDVKSSVDYSTGNIEFPNDVIIHEGVHDNFKVHAQGNIEIHKLVQASVLDAAKNIELKGGMAGRDTGTIKAGGDLSAKYLDGVHATVSGNCSITKEITNCHLQIAGMIDCPSSALRGGETNIAKGGVINTVGSERGVETDLIIGSLPLIEEKAAKANQLQSQLATSISKQIKELEMFKGNLGKITELQQEQVREMESQIAIEKRQLIALDEAISRLINIRSEHTAHRLTVKSCIYAKTKIWIPGYRVYFERDVKGELIIDLDESFEPIITRNGKSEPLRTVAKVSPDERVFGYTRPTLPNSDSAAPSEIDSSEETQPDNSENGDQSLPQAA